jgi:hypothetical protein
LPLVDGNDVIAKAPVPDPHASIAAAARRPALIATGVAVLASWLLPLGADALRIDWVLPVLLLVATASLLRAGRTVLDRLVLATGLLLGATCGLGLLLSVWPWHLHPVPVTGFAGTGLALVALALRRRPSFPRTVTLPDLMVVAATLVAAVVPLAPLRHGAIAWRLGAVVSGEDFARHYLVFDGIRHSGGYLFLHRHLVPYVPDGFVSYPQGSHLTLALLENFLRSSPLANTPLGSMDHLAYFSFFSAAFLFLCVLWAIRWVAGPWLTGWTAAPVLAVAAGYLAFSDPINLIVNGYISEMPGLGLLVLAMALAARPVGRMREQLVLMCVLTVGVAYVYYMWLPVLGLVWLGWLVRYRRQVRAVWRTAAVALPVAAVLSMVPPLSNLGQTGGSVLLESGGASHVNRTAVFAFAVLAVAPLGLQLVRRVPVWRFAVVEVGAAVLFAAAIGLYQYRYLGFTTYYFEKTLHELAMVSLVWLGAPAMVLLAEPRREHWARVRDRARRGLAWWQAVPWRAAGWRALAAGATCVVLAATTMALWALPLPTSSTRGLAYLRDKQSFPLTGDAIDQVYRHFPEADGYVTLVLTMTGHQYQSAWQTLYVNDLQRNYPAAIDLYVWMFPNTTPDVTTPKLQQYLLEHHVRARIVSITPAELSSYRAFGQQHPELGISVVDARGWWRKPAL